MQSKCRRPEDLFGRVQLALVYCVVGADHILTTKQSTTCCHLLYHAKILRAALLEIGLRSV